MTVCGAVGALMVGGRVVGQLRCGLEAGHAEGIFPRATSEPGAIPRVYQFAATPHRVVLEWTPETDPDLDLFDPAESFDVDVPLGTPGLPCPVEGCDLDGAHDGLHDVLPLD